jgi:hypothetical protein
MYNRPIKMMVQKRRQIFGSLFIKILQLLNSTKCKMQPCCFEFLYRFHFVELMLNELSKKLEFLEFHWDFSSTNLILETDPIHVLQNFLNLVN